VCPDPLYAVGDHVLESHQRAVRLAVVAVVFVIQLGAPLHHAPTTGPGG
jgi:hypothetical protein